GFFVGCSSAISSWSDQFLHFAIFLTSGYGQYAIPLTPTTSQGVATMLARLRLRSKVLLLALGPICLLTLILSSIALVVLDDLADQQEAQTRAKLVQDRKTEIKQYVELAMNAIAPLYQASAEGDMAAREQAVQVLKRLSYGVDGYFWGYDTNIRRVLQGNTGDRIGEDFSSYRDPSGLHAIRELVRAGVENTHYTDYSFVLGDSKVLVPKVGYSQ